MAPAGCRWRCWNRPLENVVLVDGGLLFLPEQYIESEVVGWMSASSSLPVDSMEEISVAQ